MRPIDADAIMRIHKLETSTIGKDWTVRDLATAIELAPTINAIPVEWIRSKITGEKKDAGAVIHDGVLKELLFDWQKEQEAR